MPLRRFMLAGAFAGALFAQSPTAPIISARGVTNFFTQEPAPGIVGLGGLVQISGLNLGPLEGAIVDSIPWSTRLAGTQVIIGGKPAPLYSVAPGSIVAQVPYDANAGLVDVIVRRNGANSTPARVFINALYPTVRTADDSGAGAPWGKVTDKTISGAASGLGPTDPKLESGDVPPTGSVAAPTSPIAAYVGGLRAKVTATASAKRPGEFDLDIAVPAGARPGDLITFVTARQVANPTLYQPSLPMSAPELQWVPFTDRPPALTVLTDTGVNGNFLLATANRDSDGCYPALAINIAAKSIVTIPDCLTSVNPNIQPLAVPGNGDSIAALTGPPAGDAATGISNTVKIFSAAAGPLKVVLPSAAATLTPTPNGIVATLPGKTAQIATIDPVTGEFETTDVVAGAGLPGTATGGVPGVPGAGAGAGALANLKVDVNGLKQIYASVNVGQNRIAVIVGDDSLKPVKAAFAIVNAAGDVQLSKRFPDGLVPLLTAVQPARPNQATPPPPTTTIFFDTSTPTRTEWVLARATDASKDAFLGFALADANPKSVPFPDGWFATSCTADIRFFNLDLVRQIALAGSRVAETEFKASCPASGFLLLDLVQPAVTALPIGDGGQIRVPVARNDASMGLMNNYVYAAKLDSTRAATSDTLYVLDGVNANVFTLPVPSTVNAFTNATLQQIPDMNALLVQTIDRTAGDQGMVLFNLDTAKAMNLPVPEGFTTVNNLDDGTTVCCLATRKLVGRALKQGGSNIVVYSLANGDVSVVPNPEGVTSAGPPPAAGQGAGQGAAATRLILANSRANTVSAVAYSGNRQVGIMVVRVP